MKRHRSGDSGFSLIEIMVVLIMLGVLGAIALPSFLAQQQEMRKTVNSTMTLLKTVNLTARANSGNPYRITVASKVINGETQQQFKVETETSGTCDVNRDVVTDPPIWRHDPSKDFYLPTSMRITGFPTEATTNGICFDSRGNVYRGTANNIPITFQIEDIKKGSITRSAVFNISSVGDITFSTFGEGGQLPAGSDGVNGSLN
jgi:prepilin-type N-terminal cleavage/methylation domain-containing protein